jgi:hypothetical protein
VADSKFRFFVHVPSGKFILLDGTLDDHGELLAKFVTSSNLNNAIEGARTLCVSVGMDVCKSLIAIGVRSNIYSLVTLATILQTQITAVAVGDMHTENTNLTERFEQAIGQATAELGTLLKL